MFLPADKTTNPGLGDTGSMRGEIGPALTELPTRQRQVLSLRYLAGLDETDVGRGRDIGEGSEEVCGPGHCRPAGSWGHSRGHPPRGLIAPYAGVPPALR